MEPSSTYSGVTHAFLERCVDLVASNPSLRKASVRRTGLYSMVARITTVDSSEVDVRIEAERLPNVGVFEFDVSVGDATAGYAMTDDEPIRSTAAQISRFISDHVELPSHAPPPSEVDPEAVLGGVSGVYRAVEKAVRAVMTGSREDLSEACNEGASAFAEITSRDG